MMIGGQDAMQVCRNGHYITDRYHSNPDARQKYCEECGAETIIKCQNCDAEIPGDDLDSAVLIAAEPNIPNNCADCGAPYPWSEQENSPESEEQFDSKTVEADTSELSDNEIKEKGCSHNSSHKEVIADPKSGGASAAGFGANYGSADIKIVCKKCETVYEVEEKDESEDKFGLI